jgi:hypothetical protein
VSKEIYLNIPKPISVCAREVKNALSKLELNKNDVSAYKLCEYMEVRQKTNIAFWKKQVEKLNQELIKMIDRYNKLLDKFLNGIKWFENNEDPEVEAKFALILEEKDSIFFMSCQPKPNNDFTKTGKILEIAEFIKPPKHNEKLNFEDFKLKSKYQEYLELFTAYQTFSPPQEPKKIVTEQLELITS